MDSVANPGDESQVARTARKKVKTARKKKTKIEMTSSGRGREEIQGFESIERSGPSRVPPPPPAPEALVGSTQWAVIGNRSKLMADSAKIPAERDIAPLVLPDFRAERIPTERDVDDTWLDSWDGRIHRCSNCDRPFRDQARLATHIRVHRDGAPKIETYTRPQTAANTSWDLENLEEIMLGGGDLILETTDYDGEPVGYLVGSQILCNSSPVFRAMLGRYSTSKEAIDMRRAAILGRPPAVIELEDDHNALGQVLKVLHHRYDLPEEDIDFEELATIAGICLKYELRRSLQALADRLVDSLCLKESLGRWLYYENCLLIAYVFEYEKLFASCTKQIILGDSWLNDAPEREEFMPLSDSIPLHVIERMHHERARFVKILRTQIKTLQTEWGTPFSIKCLRNKNQRKCTTLGLGNLLKTVVEYKLNETETWNKPLSKITEQFNEIVPLSLDSHMECDWAPPLIKLANSTYQGVKGLSLSDVRHSGG
ncbi:hypothetical protein BZA05DRAFT_169275 [Tricharina praecox]|uniref:uncharacterized protein n=1 Tax=Tricharina praecox TaxID=43433 RepID=UPI002220713D|nr:uncharacterized protein BZA05DRAFT_169275 [Tricharina praecox]KAI5857240.1 hypothetical protein BZA05DRAFT_169275 [Tricharina praecox]